jgi:hypothetical protein
VDEEQPDRDALVIRFRPTQPDAMLSSAQKAFRQGGAYRLSIFADSARDGEDEEALIGRLLRAAELSHISNDGNPKFWLCTSAGELIDDGFVFRKDKYPGEEPEHYSIDLGNTPTLGDTEKLARHFPESRSRP